MGLVSAPDLFADTSEVSADGARNRLARESSPYLLLHAENPVDWYPWGTEAIERARVEDKPIFLSIGYSSCYWCHVMERKVFSDPEIAKLMNQWFVNVKVDREERPDLDEIYMAATVLMTGRGGWPNSVFLTPELQPFFAGTYFPPEDSQGRPGFATVLTALNRAWTEERPAIFDSAVTASKALEEWIARERPPLESVPGVEKVALVVDALKKTYDSRNGGFGNAPKFPSPASLQLLWATGLRGDAEARKMVLETLSKMGAGGIYDHLGGGFHRYSTDAQWLIPHFEKMLYDNALLGELLARAGAGTKDSELIRLARGTLDFVLRDMTRSEGAFKSAINSETDGEEGAYYVWTAEELENLLGEEAFGLMGTVYGFDGEPNFEGVKYALHLPESLDDRAKELALGRTELLDRMKGPSGVLLKARGEREHPLVDDKVLTDWNGMMISSMAVAGQLLDEERYIKAATTAAEFILETLRDDSGVLLHSWRNGDAKIRAFVDDYAYLIRGLLDLHGTTGEERWLKEAQRLSAEATRRLGDPQGGYFLAEAKTHLLFQPKTITDGAIPSGNGVMLLNEIELASRGGSEASRQTAEALLKSFGSELDRVPQAVPSLALGLLRLAELSEN